MYTLLFTIIKLSTECQVTYVLGCPFKKSSSFIANPASQPKFTIHLVFTGFNNSLLYGNRNISELIPLKNNALHRGGSRIFLTSFQSKDRSKIIY